MKIFLFIISFLLKYILSNYTVKEENYRIIPLPKKIELMKGNPFILSSNTIIIYPKNDIPLEKLSKNFSSFIQDKTKLKLNISSKLPKKKKNIILLLYDVTLKEEEYNIIINENIITISSSTAKGILYGINTIRKSLPLIKKEKSDIQISLTPIKINDYPTFKYRSIMLDCSRHFFPISFLKKLIQILSFHNLNYLHWHLTDDQGWRIEIKKYPLLTEIGSQRTNSHIERNTEEISDLTYGSFYTQEEIKDFINYAKENFITIIPEIDMPGHMLSLLSSYPKLGCSEGPYQVTNNFGIFSDILCVGKEETFNFIEDILNELLELFPSEFIHIGGDEAPKTKWNSCSLCNQRKKEENIDSYEHLQGYFSHRIQKYLSEKGRRIIGWDEILEGNIQQSAIIMSWRGINSGENGVNLGHEVIMCPMSNMYFDYSQNPNHWAQPRTIGGLVNVSTVYHFNPYGNIQKNLYNYVIGVQANLWTEYIFSEGGVMFQLLPRMAALSEVQWGIDNYNYSDFKNRINILTEMYDLYGYVYEREFIKNS